MSNILTSEEKRQNAAKIAQAAMRLFKQSSYNQISMKQVADSAGISKGTLFNYYKNKEDLFMTLLLVGYQNYFSKLIHQLENQPLKNKSDLYSFLIGEVKNLIDHHSSLVRLNALRGPIFEGKANLTETKIQRRELYSKSNELSQLIKQQIGEVNIEWLNHIFVIQSAIISGMLNLSGLEAFSGKPTGQNLPAFSINITEEATKVFSSYLKEQMGAKNETGEYS